MRSVRAGPMFPKGNERRGRRRVACVATAAVAACIAAQARAQTQARPTGASLSLTETYDTNVARSDEATAELRHVTREDELFTPALDLELGKAIGRQNLFLTGTIGYAYYQRNTFLDSQHIDLTGGATGSVASCHGTVTGQLGQFQSDLQDLTQVQVKNLETRQSIKIDADCARPIGLTPTFSISEATVSNSAAGRQAANNQTLETEAGLSYSRPNLGQLALFGRYSDSEYPDLVAVTLPAGFVDRNISYSGGVRFSRQVSSRLGGSIELTYTKLQPNAPNSSPFSGPTYLLDVYFKPNQRIRMDINAQRATIPSNTLGSTYATSDTYSGDVDYTLGKVELKVGASRSSQHYQGGIPAATSALQPTITQQTVDDVFGSASMHIARKYLLSINARWETRRADVVNFGYQDLRTGVTVSANF
jgi:hypothetical protein